MDLMPRLLFLIVISSALILSSCAEKQVCPTPGDDRQYLSQADLVSLEAPAADVSPAEVSVGGKMMTVNRVVSGPLCNDRWQGTVYVGCEVQVLEWSETPLFLKDCDLTIEPGTVVYVADHNDAAYYNGCSCHTGELP